MIPLFLKLPHFLSFSHWTHLGVIQQLNYILYWKYLMLSNPLKSTWLETSHLWVPKEEVEQIWQSLKHALSSLMELFQHRRYESAKSTSQRFTFTVCWFQLIRWSCSSVMRICLEGSWFVPPCRSVSTLTRLWVLWILTLASANLKAGRVTWLPSWGELLVHHA